MPSEQFEKYIDLCRQHHETHKTFSGRGVLKHSRALLKLAYEVEARTGLDYGCGKGTQYEEVITSPGGVQGTLEELLRFKPYRYDPAVRAYEKPPEGKFDLVWCTDVLEHIPEEDIPYVVGELFYHADRALFVTVGFGPAKKSLPNGENAHICQKPEEWWREQFDAVQKERALKKLKAPRLELLIG